LLKARSKVNVVNANNLDLLSDSDFDAILRVSANDAVEEEVEKGFEKVNRSWDRHGDLELVGHGRVTNDKCGKYMYLQGCLNGKGHKNTLAVTSRVRLTFELRFVIVTALSVRNVSVLGGLLVRLARLNSV